MSGPMATPATGDDSLQQLWLGKELPDGVASAILVPTSSELLLRNLIQAAERLGITYSVDRAKKENQLLIKPEVIDLTEEPELPDRPAEAAPQPPQEQSLPSQVNRPIGNFGWQSNQFRTLPFLLNKNFNYAGNLPYSFPMTGTGIPNMMPSYRELPPMGIAPGLPFFSCNQNANGEFRMNSDPGARLSVHFADERPLSGVVRRREEEDDEEDEHGDGDQDGRRSRRSRTRIRRQHQHEHEHEDEIFQEVLLDFRVEPGRVRHACQEIGCRSSVDQRNLCQHIQLHRKRMPHLSRKKLAERCFPQVAWAWVS